MIYNYDIDEKHGISMKITSGNNNPSQINPLDFIDSMSLGGVPVDLTKLKRNVGRPSKNDDDKTWNKITAKAYHKKYYQEKIQKKKDEERLNDLLLKLGKELK